MRTFDLIVIGSGSGLEVSSEAGDRGLSVAVVEHGPFGGTCLNRGCIPSKMLIHSAGVIQDARSPCTARSGMPKHVEMAAALLGEAQEWLREVPVLDHVAYGVPDLDAACHELAERLGVRPMPGGQHRGLDTHNAILALGEGVYLEVIAPDPNQPPPSRSRPFGLDALVDPRLVAWAAKAPDIESRVESARSAGYDPGNVIKLGRELPNGGRLDWRLTFPDELAGDGLVPFLIDWGSAPHPSFTAPQGCSLLSLRGEHPQPERVTRQLQALEVDLNVAQGPAAALIATLMTPKGEVELR